MQKDPKKKTRTQRSIHFHSQAFGVRMRKICPRLAALTRGNQRELKCWGNACSFRGNIPSEKMLFTKKWMSDSGKENSVTVVRGIFLKAARGCSWKRTKTHQAIYEGLVLGTFSANLRQTGSATTATGSAMNTRKRHMAERVETARAKLEEGEKTRGKSIAPGEKVTTGEKDSNVHPFGRYLIGTREVYCKRRASRSGVDFGGGPVRGVGTDPSETGGGERTGEVSLPLGGGHHLI